MTQTTEPNRGVTEGSAMPDVSEMSDSDSTGVEAGEESQLESPQLPSTVVDKLRDGDARWETGEIPAWLRAAVLERDTGHCRLCGAVPESPALHHIRYRSAGGRNELDNLVTLHWMYAPRCHEMVHSNGRLWRPILEQVVLRPGVSGLQLVRWQRAQQRRRGRPVRSTSGGA